MIHNKDRSGWFGASDTHYITGNWSTNTFAQWWLIKLGLTRNVYENKYMFAGTHYEHKILDCIGVPEKDRQVKIRKYRLRVNLDGSAQNCIYEVKTYKFSSVFRVNKAYWQQAQIQMFVTGIKTLYIVAYGMLDEDYRNIFNSIDEKRISYHRIEYDPKFISDVYLPRLLYLRRCMKYGVYPDWGEYCAIYHI